MKPFLFALLPSIAAAGLWAATAFADVPNEDTSPPNVSIPAPEADAMLTGDPAVVMVTVVADDPDSGVSEVRLSVDGMPLAPLTEGPYTWSDVELAVGNHVLLAEADNADAYSAAASINVTVTADGGSGGGGGSASGDGGGADDGNGDGGGCSTSARPRAWIGGGVAFGFALLAGIVLRRRPR